MAGRNKDIDPASELVEDDEEQALPDSEELELGDEQASGPLAAGRAALLRHAKLAPSAPGVYRMLDAAARCSTSARRRTSGRGSRPTRGRPGTTPASNG